MDFTILPHLKSDIIDELSACVILTPLVQKRAVRLLPIVTILAQFLMWVLTGLLGVAIATPLTAGGQP